MVEEQLIQEDPINPKTKALYDAVSKNYNIGTFDEFNDKLKDSSKRKAFYDGVGSEYQLGSYSDFETKVGAKKKSASFYTRFKWWINDIWYAITHFPRG